MTKNLRYMLIAMLVVGLTTHLAHGQLLNKVKGKGEQEAGKAIDNLFGGKKKKDQGNCKFPRHGKMDSVNLLSSKRQW